MVTLAYASRDVQLDRADGALAVTVGRWDGERGVDAARSVLRLADADDRPVALMNPAEDFAVSDPVSPLSRIAPAVVVACTATDCGTLMM